MLRERLLGIFASISRLRWRGSIWFDDLWEPWPKVEPLTTDEEYARVLRVALVQLLCASAEKMPRLKSVCLQACEGSWGRYHEETPETKRLCTVESRTGGGYLAGVCNVARCWREVGIYI